MILPEAVIAGADVDETLKPAPKPELVISIAGVVLSALLRVLFTLIPAPRPFCVTATAAEPTDDVLDGVLLTVIAEPSVA